MGPVPTWAQAHFRVATGQFEIAAEAALGKYGKIAKLPRHAQILYAFAYVFAMFAASPAPIMESTRGAAASIMCAEEAAKIQKKKQMHIND